MTAGASVSSSGKRLCALGDLAEGGMAVFELDGTEVIVLWPRGGSPRAYDAACPHEGISLGFGEFDGMVLACGAHQWTFSAASGCSIYPEGSRLREHRIELHDDQVVLFP